VNRFSKFCRVTVCHDLCLYPFTQVS
jgi:hypothetical protein